MTQVLTTQTPPMLHGPSDKEKKYDRQLRLWAASGQAALESANILLLNTGAGTVGVETLKNLVLPGIGRFTIIDNAKVTEADLGVNFFLDEASLGKSRAQICTELLLELNPEVEGDWFPKNDDSLDLGKLLSELPTFTMIVYSFPIQPGDLEVLQNYGQKNLTPLVAVHSAGLYSYFRVGLPGTFPVVDTHPDETATTDLRLLSPWPELEAFATEMTADIDRLENHEHGHLPYVVILLHFLRVWKDAHGDYPRKYTEKKAFQKLVAAGERTDNPEGGEENFAEAIAAVVKTVVAPTLPSSLKEVFEHPANSEIEQHSKFWLIADAIKTFHARHGALPLPGNVPDMKAQSTVYIRLQNIYKDKARRDVAEVLEITRQSPGGEHVDPDEVELFCKNAAFVKLVNVEGANTDRLARVVEEELEKDANAEVMMSPLSLIPIYLALSATSHDPKASRDSILGTLRNLIPDALENERVLKIADEVARAGGGELHNTSALTGGMVAQEIIKIITKQYIPVDNTCIFDGISSRCQVLRL
ncbi:hypothetical protein BD289DRAFT_449816 [Coniella lustricola]|uniref:NEDD8-activating enzyme E1 regulatory subunit n=1 Tax=Coniella lustricola TaxID=2025994 RepID=A0A2T3AKY1_9PEZI|nr:hypothetical protein BD289DRAFT_449816 [Coniella lustricola]